MPRYYFNTRIGDELISDPDGEVLVDPDRAWEMTRAMIRQLLKTDGADGVGNQLIADTGVEIISRHRRKLHSRWGPEIGGPHFPHGFLYGTPAAPRNPTIVIRNRPNNRETLDPTLF